METKELIITVLPLFGRGFVMTVLLWLCSGLLSISFGSLLGIAAAARSTSTLISSLIRIYVFILRGIPVYIQLLIAYFALPQLLGINITPFTAAVLALGICSSAYVTEIVRAGINAIPALQWDACYVLGYTRLQTLWYIIIPQVWRIILPALANECDAILKSTAILSSIGVLELTRVASNMVSRHMNPEIMYPCVALFYLLLSSLILIFSRYIERRFANATRS